MADSYTIESDGRGGFSVKPSGSGWSFAIGMIVVMLIAGFLVTNCDSEHPSQPQNPTGSSQSGSNTPSNPQPPTSVNLADLHVYDCHTDVTNNNIRRESTTDPFGKRYEGPYFCLTDICSVSGEAYTELVTGGNYKYLSGTFFADADYEDREICFRIYADNVLIYDSGFLTRRDGAKDFTVDIQNATLVRVASLTQEGDDHAHILLVNAIVHNDDSQKPNDTPNHSTPTESKPSSSNNLSHDFYGLEIVLPKNFTVTLQEDSRIQFCNPSSHLVTVNLHREDFIDPNQRYDGASAAEIANTVYQSILQGGVGTPQLYVEYNTPCIYVKDGASSYIVALYANDDCWWEVRIEMSDPSFFNDFTFNRVQMTMTIAGWSVR